MATQTESIMENHVNDPVTKAVVDNIMGHLPTKKPLVRCDDCDLSFTSQVVLDAHLQGARHAKQMRSKNIMDTLKETQANITKDQETNGLKCNVCNVCLNSIQQLQTHLNGNRHKKKVSKGDWTTSAPVVSEATPAPVPPPVVEAKPTPNKIVTLTCDLCNKFFNSQAQLDVHLQSKKHTDKVNNKSQNRNKRRFFPYWKKNKQIQIQPTRNNFVSGGYYMS